MLEKFTLRIPRTYHTQEYLQTDAPENGFQDAKDA